MIHLALIIISIPIIYLAGWMVLGVAATLVGAVFGEDEDHNGEANKMVDDNV